MSIKNLLRQLNIKPKKFLGQNFLVDERVLEKIIAAADLSKNDVVLEIGPGLGILTERLTQKAKLIMAVEKDKNLADFLREKFKDKENLKIVQGDILKFKPQDFELQPFGYKVAANIPYYLTSRLMRILLESKQKPSKIVLLVQKEVALRICAKKEEHSLLSLSVQYYGQPEIQGYVSKNAFYPKPKVDSAILKIEVFKKPPHYVKDERTFFKIMHAAFQTKRKQLKNSLARNLKIPKAEMEKYLSLSQINERSRPQDLGLSEFKNIYLLIHKEIEKKADL